MNINWEKLVCRETVKPKINYSHVLKDYAIDTFEQDCREVVSSVSFRSLQDKTQVYQLERRNLVRTRLTHSLEVSTIAKQLGMMVLFNNKWHDKVYSTGLTIEQAFYIPSILSCAGLLHDMGNPPFGHEGERAIKKWFSRRFEDNRFAFNGKPIRELFSTQMVNDLCNFDGNAQVLRLLSKARFEHGKKEANVTYATISALIKYPVNSNEIDVESADERKHKLGFFATEQDFVKTVREKTGIYSEEEPFARNPLTFLLEAADDISYIASDIEDAVVKRHISIPQIIDYVHEKLEKLSDSGDEEHLLSKMTTEGILNNLIQRMKKPYGYESDRMQDFFQWTNHLRNWLMYLASNAFVNNIDSIMNGTFSGDLISKGYHKYTANILKSEMKEYVYPKLGDVNAASMSILSSILERFVDSVINWDTENEMDIMSKEYMEDIPDEIKASYFEEKTADEVYNLYLRFRMVMDYISGIDDGHAVTLFKKWAIYI